MTTPLERTRAVIHTKDFLMDLIMDLDLPKKTREDAKHLLRHFPDRHNFASDTEYFASYRTLKQEQPEL